MIRVAEIEGGVFKIVMDRPGIVKMRNMLTHDDDHTTLVQWCQEMIEEHNIREEEAQ